MAFLLPNSDPALLAWSLNFSTKISATPTAFGLTAAQATAYAALHAAYATTLAACDPAVRSKQSVVAKDAARDTLKTSAKQLCYLVLGTPTVTDAQKVSLGINVRAKPQPIPAPTATPLIEFVSVVGNTVRVKLKDNEASKRGKPAGCAGASIFSATGPVPPTDPSAFRFEGNTSKSVIDVVFPLTLAPGTRVWITAFWFNGKMESGPSCAPIGVYLQGGVVPMAA